MSPETDPLLEVPFTYLLPMREDNPAFADFEALRDEVIDVMGEEYPSPLVTRINTMLAGNSVGWRGGGVKTYYAMQESGYPGSVRAITFDAPLSVERLSSSNRGIGQVAARALIGFAVGLQADLQAGHGPKRSKVTSKD